MPVFDPITETEITPGQPIVGLGGFGEKAKENFDYLYGAVTGSAVSGLPNNSFEVDSDSDGTPDGWTKNLYAGGSGGIDTVSPIHGSACIKFVHPGGAGNGGGYLTCDYVSCSPLVPVFLELAHWVTNAAMHNQIQLLFYNAAKLYLSTTTVYDAALNPTTPGLFLVGATPPASARFMKVRLIGGQTDVNAAGSAYFDGSTLSPVFVNRNRAAIQDFTLSEVGSGTSDTWVNVGAAQTAILPISGIKQNVSFTAVGRGSVFWENIESGTSGYYSSYARFVVNGLYTSNQQFLSTSGTNQLLSFTVELPASVVGPVSIQAQLFRATSATAYIAKSTQDMVCGASF